MTRQRYSTKEALNRILRSFIGWTISSDQPGTLDREILSVDEALSDLAEALEGSLPNETARIPTSVTVSAASLPDATTSQSGIAEQATTAEAVAGTDDERFVTPLGVLSSIQANAGGQIEYGEIYNTSTGTAVVALSTSWAKITGSFQSNGPNSSNVSVDYANDRIVLNHVGLFFVGFQCSFSGTANAVIEASLYLAGQRKDAVRFRRKLGATGDVGSASSVGLINVTGTNMALELWARADAGTPNFKLETGQIWCYALPAT